MTKVLRKLIALSQKLPNNTGNAFRGLLYKLARSFDFSYAKEAMRLKSILQKLRIDSGFILDIGAGDGVYNSCTFPLFMRGGWQGLLVECNANNF